jgi:gas vesicle protein
MDYEMRDEQTGGFASSAFIMLVGAAIGAAAALILAPTSGREARAYLGRQSKRFADQGKRFADDAVEQGRKVWAEHGDRVTQAVRRGYETASNAASNAMADAENRLPRQG